MSIAQAPRLAGPTAADLERWRAADRAARPARLAALRARLEREGVEAYFGVRRENSRYLTGFELADGEEKVAGNSGQFFVSADEVVILADSRYTLQAAEQSPDARLEVVYQDFAGRWPDMLSGLRPIGSSDGIVRRIGVEAGFVSHASWQRLAAAAPEVELVPVEGWVEEQRATKEPSEIERIRAACAVADAALERLLPEIRAGQTEEELALRLEWEMRTSGAEALAFDVACLSGPRAALPHGSPGERRLTEGEVLLFDFGAQVCGYRSDMTRTLFVGTPSEQDRLIYGLVREAQETAFEALQRAVDDGERPSNRAIDGAARAVIADAGHGERFGHGLGHGIGLATHEAPSLGRLAPEAPLPSPTVFSVEPGIYLDGITGVRIEDLVLFDADARRLERLTSFTREVTVVG
ncbi:MAG TPA: Xaa-Pro peptidase family protein [Candidatus Limnocylindria bacterium]|nr:Xaa-Pro peptidase family protein [Candidatus Limnocylindria bacterium]